MRKRSTVGFFTGCFIALVMFVAAGCGGSSSTTSSITKTGATLTGQVATPKQGAPKVKLPSKQSMTAKLRGNGALGKSRTLKAKVALARRAKFLAEGEGLEGAVCQLVDAETKKAVTDNTGANITSTTLSDGSYSLEGVPAGKSYAIICTKTAGGDGTVIKIAVEEVTEGQAETTLPDADEESTMACEKYLDKIEAAYTADANFDPDSVDFDELLAFYEQLPDDQMWDLYEKYDAEIEEVLDAGGTLSLENIGEVDSTADAVGDLFVIADTAFESSIAGILGSGWEDLLDELTASLDVAGETLESTLAALEATQQSAPKNDYFEYLAEELTKLSIPTEAADIHESFEQSDATLAASLDAATTQTAIDAAYERFYVEQDLINYGVNLADTDTELDQLEQNLEDALTAAHDAGSDLSLDDNSFSGGDVQVDPAAECEAFGGTYNAVTSECAPPTDAAGGTGLSQEQCEAYGGTFDTATGECTFPSTETTMTGLTETECVAAGGNYDATTGECKVPTTEGAMNGGLTQADCEAQGGTYDATAGCDLSGVTEVVNGLAETECVAIGGMYDAATGACDVPAEGVTGISQTDCEAQGGHYESSTGTCDFIANTTDFSQTQCESFGGTYDAATGDCAIPPGGYTTVAGLTQTECEAQSGHYDTTSGDCHLPATTIAKAKSKKKIAGKKNSTSTIDAVYEAYNAIHDYAGRIQGDVVAASLGLTLTDAEYDIVDTLMDEGSVDVNNDGNVDATIDYQAVSQAAEAAVASSTLPTEPDWATIYSDGDISDSEQTAIDAYYDALDAYYSAYQDAEEEERNTQLVAAITTIGTTYITWAGSAQSVVERFDAIHNIQETAWDAYVTEWDSYWASVGTGTQAAYDAYDTTVEETYKAIMAKLGVTSADEAQNLIEVAYEEAQAAYWAAINSYTIVNDGETLYAYDILSSEELNTIASGFDDVPGESFEGEMKGLFDDLGASETQQFTMQDAAHSFENGEMTQEEFDSTIESTFESILTDKGVAKNDVGEFFQDVDQASSDYFAEIEDATDADGDDDGDGVDSVDEALSALITDLKTAIEGNLNKEGSADDALVATQEESLLNTLLLSIAGEVEEAAQAKLRIKGKAV